MFIILTLEIADDIVRAAVESILNGLGIIPAPNGAFVLCTGTDTQVEGDGGQSRQSSVLVIVGHGNANSISGHSTWRSYVRQFPGSIDLTNIDQVYVVACSTADEGNAFLHGNIASEIRAAFPNATVFASSSSVGAHSQSGDWQKL